MGDKYQPRTLGDYSRPSHEDYQNTIELPEGDNVLPRYDTIRLVQNKCAFHRLQSKDPNQYLKDFLKLMDSLDLNGANRERTSLRMGIGSLHAKNLSLLGKWKWRFLTEKEALWMSVIKAFYGENGGFHSSTVDFHFMARLVDTRALHQA
ncbi:hypothetical protein Tco_0469565 [Tanacetum coccineum]